MIKQLLRFIRGPKRKRRSAGVRSVSLEHQGEHYNLKTIYERLNVRYFEGKLDLPITWSGYRQSMPRTKVLFGSYNHRTKLIKIHRRLDQVHVPEHFISFVIYHEMLHHVLPPVRHKRGKRRIHHPAFIEREKQFEEYALAREYEVNSKKSWFRI